jgi:hypothetical protein
MFSVIALSPFALHFDGKTGIAMPDCGLHGVLIPKARTAPKLTATKARATVGRFPNITGARP